MTAQDEAIETLQVLSAPAGLNTKRLFVEPLSSPEQRFDRLEREVQDLRDDFDLVSPAITRLVAVEQDMRDLMNQLGTLIAAEQPGPTPGIDEDKGLTPQQVDRSKDFAPVVITEPMKPPVVAAAATIDAEVRGLRIGEHIDKSRVVIDMTAESDFSVEVSGDRRAVTVLLPHADWDTAQSWSSDVSPLIANWKVEPLSAEGHKIVFNLREPSSVKRQAFLPPKGGLNRLVIDFYSPDIHLSQ